MSATDDQTIELQRSLDRSRIERAGALTVLERLRLSADLYDEGIRWVRLAILGENPEFTPAQVDAEIERRKRVVRRIDDNGLFQPCGRAESEGEV